MPYFAHMDSAEIVSAEMLTGDNVTVLANWSRAVIVEEIDPTDPEAKFPGLNVQCRDSVKRASLGDYILRHDDGTFDVKRPIEFHRNYQPGK